MDSTKEKLSREEYDALAQHELRNLERDFRKMLSDREEVSKKNRKILTSQKKVIAILEKEKEYLLDELNILSKSKVHDDEAIRTVNDVADLLKKFEAMTLQKKEKAKQLQEVKSVINKVTEKIEAAKREQINDRGDGSKQDQINEQLNNCLRVEAENYGKVETETEKLRKEAELLLVNRKDHRKMIDAIVKDLSSGKRLLSDLVEQSNIAYESRQKKEIKIAVLRNEAKKNLRTNITEIWGRHQEIDEKEHLNKFLEVKSRVRDVSAMQAEKQSEEDIVTNKLMSKLDDYEDIINKIVTTFKKRNMDKLIEEYKKIESDNDNIYSFLNDQNARINYVRAEVEILENSIAEQKRLNRATWRGLIEDEARLRKVHSEKVAELLELDQTAADLDLTLREVYLGIKEMFENLECDWRPFLAMLGTNEEVTAENWVEFLRIVESRLRMFATQFSATQKAPSTIVGRASLRERITKSRKRNRTGKFGAIVLPATPCPICLETFDSSDQNEIVEPLILEDVRSLVAEERRKGRWHELMHALHECPLPQAQRVIRKRLSNE